MKRPTFKINFGGGWVGSAPKPTATEKYSEHGGNTMNFQTINEEPLITQQAYWDSEPNALAIVKSELNRLYKPMEATARLQQMTAADVEQMAAEITAEARVKDPATRNSSRTCNNCDEEETPLLMPRPWEY